VEHVYAKLWRITVDPHGMAHEVFMHLPIEDLGRVSEVKVNGNNVIIDAAIPLIWTNKVPAVTTVEVELQ